MKAVITYMDSQQIGPDSWRTFERAVHLSPDTTIKDIADEFPAGLQSSQGICVTLIIEREDIAPVANNKPPRGRGE